MNQEIKAQWIAALRSGEYARGKGYLNRQGMFCCLGVLCEVAIKNNVAIQKEERIDEDGEDDAVFIYNEEVYYLPDQVMEWAEIPDDNECSRRGHILHKSEEWTTLAEANDADDDLTFDQIADLIEANF
jgi:hypothetical protein